MGRGISIRAMAAALAAAIAGLAALAGSASGASAQREAADAPPAHRPPAPFWLETAQAAIHEVGYAQLAEAGLSAQPETARIALESAGEPVPLLIQDGGDGRFGPGDWLAFAAAGAPEDETSPLRVHRLSFDAEAPSRVEVVSGGDCARGDWRRRVEVGRVMHHEVVPGAPGVPRTTWYWSAIHHTSAGQRVLLALDDLASAPGEVRIRIHARGRTTAPKGEDRPDHRVLVELDGQRVHSEEWDGSERVTIELHPIESARLLRPEPEDTASAGAAGEKRPKVRGSALRIRVGKRKLANGDPFVDSVLIEDVEVVYRARARSARSEAWLRLEPGKACAEIGIAAPWIALRGTRALLASGRVTAPAALFADPELDERKAELRMAPVAGLASPYRIERREWPGPSLRDAGRAAAYVALAPGSLLPGLEPLLALHRERGLTVAAIDVQRVFDDFGHGAVHPRAVRDFLAHARASWQVAPRFVLLVGEASYDPRLRSPTRAKRRPDAVPTWSASTRGLVAASDLYFSDLGEREGEPVLAIGRLPVADRRELAAVVHKTVGYLRSPPDGDWRSDVLFVTDGTPRLERDVPHLVELLRRRGFSTRHVSPVGFDPESVHAERLLSALEPGALVLHYSGHGGRQHWRLANGPNALANVFRAGRVETIAPHPRLPVVLSMSCASAPFDHPTFGSIGESFLLAEERGAVAVIAASSENDPGRRASEILLAELLDQATIGEALAATKRRLGDREFSEAYNLLGDPALRLALPDSKAADRGGQPAHANAATRAMPARGPAAEQASPGDPGSAAPLEGARTLANVVRWSTALELDSFGFDVYRASAPEGPFERLTSESIPAAGRSDVERRYRYVDDTIEPGLAYYYYVERISLSGARERLTPVQRSEPKQAVRAPL